VTVAIVSPGAMGSALGAALSRGGERVVATVSGRSARTARLAGQAGIVRLDELDAVVREAGIVLSVVPPEFSARVAGDLGAAARRSGTAPLLVDLNAVAPATAREAERIAADSGCELVDGSISGPPPRSAGTTRIYLSGGRAAEVAQLPFDGVETIVVGPAVGAASAVKMSTASVYKGSSALLLQALRAARENGVLEHVLADLATGAPELVARVERRLALAGSKSGRYVAEMREIAQAQADAGLTPALFEAMAEVYAELARTPIAEASPEDVPAEPSLEDVLDRLA
jgi:3-hydroxyisobutyrate dehydrogenase-like beta-hydroxyacid dehydrogenase